jgi:hypothetical protein
MIEQLYMIEFFAERNEEISKEQELAIDCPFWKPN